MSKRFEDFVKEKMISLSKGEYSLPENKRLLTEVSENQLSIFFILTLNNLLELVRKEMVFTNFIKSDFPNEEVRTFFLESTKRHLDAVINDQEYRNQGFQKCFQNLYLLKHPIILKIL